MTDFEKFTTHLQLKLNTTYTDEQLDFISDFTKPTISFSSPGTGKTTAAVAGIITSELYHKINGSLIYALSFTNAATIELSNKYADVCKKLNIARTVNFKTLHSLCYSLLRQHHRLLNMPKFNVVSPDFREEQQLLLSIADEQDLPITTANVKYVAEAVNNLNASLVFDRKHIESKYLFKKCGIDYTVFEQVRAILYKTGRLTGNIKLDQILLYTLELLTTHPQVSTQFKQSCKILIVDEFQDLSLLQLRIVSLLSDTVIAIGDIKQQIYAFTGACQEIVSKFFEYFPTARRADLTQSFRCKNEIADFATQIILPNKQGGEDFKGVGNGGAVQILHGINIDGVCDKIAEDFENNRRTFKKDTLFLFRNNLSAIPIAEALFKRKIPMRINNYQSASTIPVIKGLCELCALAFEPHRLENISALQYLVPEFKSFRGNVHNHPLYKIAQKEGCSPLETAYSFSDAKTGRRAIELLQNVRTMLLNRETPYMLSEVFNSLWRMYCEKYLDNFSQYLDYAPDYYTNLVSPLVKTKTYIQFLCDEAAKLEVIRECTAVNRGVRCYTFHSAKGLEADAVYILDANRGVIPSDRKLADLAEYFCGIEAAREIRNERSLAYVACTRAKSELYISYTSNLSHLFSGVNMYTENDVFFEKYKDDFNDVKYFEEMIKQ
jgi:DNA helicase-2/ATP-dependent DNA helicase PcrA